MSSFEHGASTFAAMTASASGLKPEPEISGMALAGCAMSKNSVVSMRLRMRQVRVETPLRLCAQINLRIIAARALPAKLARQKAQRRVRQASLSLKA